MQIYISNLESSLRKEHLIALFSPFGTVFAAQIAFDIFSGESSGFGYVEMEDGNAAEAITRLHRSELMGLVISVEEADPKVVHMGSYDLSRLRQQVKTD